MIRLIQVVFLCVAVTCIYGSPQNRGRFYYGALQQFHPLNENSCVERCHTTHDPTKPCQCNKSCIQFGDCCIDYNTLCVDGSCVDRCGQVGTEPNKPCQCNKPCVTYGDCCPDYSKVCGSNGEVTDPELASLAEELLASDVNSVAAHVSANFQGSTSAGGPDNAPNVLLTVSPSAYDTYTFPKLVALFNNYIPAVGTPEVVTSGEQQEEKDFLDAILSTTIMKRTEEFLESKGLVPSGTFRAKFTEIWFGLYSRSGTVLGSSGFEHVFLGELKNGVSGFHGWAFFAQEEANTNLDYNGHLATLSLGSKGSVITHTFDWLNNKKPISSMFIGTSPEFDMAVFTVCWFARPNAKCPITLNGAKLNIQTYDITYGGKKYVASAYPDIPV